MNGNTLIVLGIVSVASMAYAMTLWTGRREWDLVKAVAVVCLAWMAIGREQPTADVHRNVVSVEGPYASGILDLLSRIERDRKGRVHVTRSE